MIVGGLEVQLVGRRMALCPGGAIKEARGIAVRLFRLQVRIATREGGDLRVGLLETGRHALRITARYILRRDAAAGRTARVDQRGPELREPVELAEVRRTE